MNDKPTKLKVHLQDDLDELQDKYDVLFKEHQAMSKAMIQKFICDQRERFLVL